MGSWWTAAASEKLGILNTILCIFVHVVVHVEQSENVGQRSCGGCTAHFLTGGDCLSVVGMDDSYYHVFISESLLL